MSLIQNTLADLELIRWLIKNALLAADISSAMETVRRCREEWPGSADMLESRHISLIDRTLNNLAQIRAVIKNEWFKIEISRAMMTVSRCGDELSESNDSVASSSAPKKFPMDPSSVDCAKHETSESKKELSADNMSSGKGVVNSFVELEKRLEDVRVTENQRQKTMDDLLAKILAADSAMAETQAKIVKLSQECEETRKAQSVVTEACRNNTFGIRTIVLLGVVLVVGLSLSIDSFGLYRSFSGVGHESDKLQIETNPAVLFKISLLEGRVRQIQSEIENYAGEMYKYLVLLVVSLGIIAVLILVLMHFEISWIETDLDSIKEKMRDKIHWSNEKSATKQESILPSVEELSDVSENNKSIYQEIGKVASLHNASDCPSSPSKEKEESSSGQKSSVVVEPASIQTKISSLQNSHRGLGFGELLSLQESHLASLSSEIGNLSFPTPISTPSCSNPISNPKPHFPIVSENKKPTLELDLSYMGLYSLPLEICKITSLERLNLAGNNIYSLPAEIGNLSSLQWLNLRDNKLSSLPPEIGKLSSLQNLILSGNRLASFPPEIAELASRTNTDTTLNFAGDSS